MSRVVAVESFDAIPAEVILESRHLLARDHLAQWQLPPAEMTSRDLGCSQLRCDTGSLNEQPIPVPDEKDHAADQPGPDQEFHPIRYDQRKGVPLYRCSLVPFF